jgi:sugar lactone lactonase YvrE
MFSGPAGVAIDTLGFVYIADRTGSVIRKINTAGEIFTLAGSYNSADSIDGTGTNSRFVTPSGMAVSADRTLYVADWLGGAVRKVSTSGIVTTLTQSSISPTAVTFSSSGDIYVSSLYPNMVFLISTGGSVTRTVVAGQLESGFGDGVGTEARFCTPNSIVFNSVGLLFVADTCNHCIRVVGTNGKMQSDVNVNLA